MRTKIIIVSIVALLMGCIADEVGGVWMVTEHVSELPSTKDYGVEVFFQAGDNWRAWSSDDWLSVSPQDGNSGRNSIRLRTVTVNRTRDRRKATVTIESGGRQQTVTVWQRNDYALFDQREYRVEAQGGEVNMSFQSNIPKDSLLIMFMKLGWYAWDADSLATRGADWHGTVKTLYVSANPSEAERSSYFILVKVADRRINYQYLDTAWVYQAGNNPDTSRVLRQMP